MKKYLLLLIISISIISVSALDWDYYASLRMFSAYTFNDKVYNNYSTNGKDDEPSLNFSGDMQSNSRLGFNGRHKDYTAKLELGLNTSSISIRQLYIKFNRDNKELLLGHTYTGFCDFASQVAFTDNGLIGSGMFYTGRVAQAKFTIKNDDIELYGAILENKSGFSPNYFHILLPRINAGLKMQRDEIKLHATSGISIISANPEVMYDSKDILSLVASVTAETIVQEGVKVKAQINYGFNAGAYGIAVEGEDVLWKTISNDNGQSRKIYDSSTIAGFVELSLNKFNGGLGYTQRDSNYYDNPMSKMTVYGNYKYDLSDYLFVVPELGLIDYMESKDKVKRGRSAYAMVKLQANI
jgi:hypothetical protein